MAPSASFESAFLFVAIVLCGSFIAAVWFLRDPALRAQQASLVGTIRAVLRRRKERETEAEHTRLRVSVERTADSYGRGAAEAGGAAAFGVTVRASAESGGGGR